MIKKNDTSHWTIFVSTQNMETEIKENFERPMMCLNNFLQMKCLNNFENHFEKP